MERLSLTLNLIRIRRALRQRRMDAKTPSEVPQAWITLKNGQHIPIDDNGVAIGGAGGWATGKRFSKAKREVPKVQSVNPTLKQRMAFIKRSKELSKKCDGLRAKLLESKTKMAPIKEARNKLNNLERSRKDYEKQLNDAEKKTKGCRTREELEQVVEKNESRIGELSSWVQKNAIKLGSGNKEVKKKMKLWSELEEENEKAKDEIKSLKRLESVQETLKGINRDIEDTQRKINDTDGSAEYEQLSREYEELANRRNEAILKAYSSPEDCADSKDVSDYLRAKGYCRKDGESAFEADGRIDLDKMNLEYAKAIATQVDGLLRDYPWLAGHMDGIECHDFSTEWGAEELGLKKGTYAVQQHTQISFAEGYFGNTSNIPEGFRGNAAKAYEKDVKSKFHPEGNDYRAVVDHEFTHVMENLVRWRAGVKGISLFEDSVSNTIMKRVQEKLYGTYDTKKEQDVREAVSRYSASNKGIYKDKHGNLVEDKLYGRNKEWLAEALSEARCSKHPREVAVAVREVFEDLIKELDL